MGIDWKYDPEAAFDDLAARVEALEKRLEAIMTVVLPGDFPPMPDELEKRLAEDSEPVPRDEPEKKVIELKRRCQCGIRGWHDGFNYAIKNKSIWPLFKGEADPPSHSDPGDECDHCKQKAVKYLDAERVKAMTYDAWPDSDEPGGGWSYRKFADAIDAEPGADVVLGSRYRCALDAITDAANQATKIGRRQGVEKVAKFMEGDRDHPLQRDMGDHIRENIDEILKEVK